MTPHQTPPTGTSTKRGGRRALRVGAAIAGAGLLLALAAPGAATAAEGDTTIDIYDINDFHGHILQSLNSPVREGSDSAGAALLAGAVEQLRAENPNSTFVSAGDNVGASIFESAVAEDQPTIDSLNAAGLTVSAIGNHELDRGQDDLRDRIIGPESDRNAKWDYISANIVDEATGEPAFDAYQVQEIGGVRVGFIGATTELLPELVSPAGIDGLEITSVVDSVNAVADELTDGDETNGEADALVLLVHEGAASSSIDDVAPDTDFGKIAYGVTPKVSAILSAHTHQKYVHDIVPTGGTVARPVLQTGSYGLNLGHLQLTVATDGAVSATVAQNDFIDPAVYTADPAVTQIVADAKAQADVEGAKVLGTIDAPMYRAVQTDGSENRGGESTLGNFVAEVQRSATERSGAQIAFMNPGGLRADLVGDADGNVTYKEAAGVQPFANTLVVLDLTGAQIKAALEQQWQPTGAGRPFLKLGISNGFSYTYDPAATAGERITSMTLNGADVDESATYKVTVNSFLASGGDNFTAFNGAAAKADSGQVDLQAQVDYFTENPAATAPVDQRAVGVTMSDAPAGGWKSGDEVTVKLSSLVFSNADDQPTSVSVDYQGTELATADIDPKIVDTTDEQGTATLTFAIPYAEEQVAPAGMVRALAAAQDSGFEIVVGNTRIAIPLAADVTAADPTDPSDPGTPGAGDGAGTGGDTGAGDDAGTGTDPVADDAAGDPATGDLAYTGSDVMWPALAAGLLLAAGLGVVLVRRRLAARRG
jgi:5'-nucleotidase